ncbi:MAG TPA: hypothetical protein VKA61_11465 [Sphingomicrobium sp.]|nr:hypothetical protein [Sphingomicrobium sp.]
MKPQQLTIAEKAKSALIENGWRQGFPLAVGDKRLCLAEAFVVALGGTGQTPEEALAAVTEAVRHMGFKDAGEAVAWNDAPDSTLEEVLERLDGWHDAPERRASGSRRLPLRLLPRPPHAPQLARGLEGREGRSSPSAPPGG